MGVCGGVVDKHKSIHSRNLAAVESVGGEGAGGICNCNSIKRLSCNSIMYFMQGLYGYDVIHICSLFYTTFEHKSHKTVYCNNKKIKNALQKLDVSKKQTISKNMQSKKSSAGFGFTVDFCLCCTVYTLLHALQSEGGGGCLARNFHV